MPRMPQQQPITILCIASPTLEASAILSEKFSSASHGEDICTSAPIDLVVVVGGFRNDINPPAWPSNFTRCESHVDDCILEGKISTQLHLLENIVTRVLYIPHSNSDPISVRIPEREGGALPRLTPCSRNLAGVGGGGLPLVVGLRAKGWTMPPAVVGLEDRADSDDEDDFEGDVVIEGIKSVLIDTASESNVVTASGRGKSVRAIGTILALSLNPSAKRDSDKSDDGQFLPPAAENLIAASDVPLVLIGDGGRNVMRGRKQQFIADGEVKTHVVKLGMLDVDRGGEFAVITMVEVEVEVEVEGEDRSKGEEACEKKKWIVENVVFEKLTRD